MDNNNLEGAMVWPQWGANVVAACETLPVTALGGGGGRFTGKRSRQLQGGDGL